MQYIAHGVIQEATTIAKTTQTVMGVELACGHYDFLTLYLDYVNGDETGVIVKASIKQATGGTAYQDCSWTGSAGTKTVTQNEYKMTASGNHYIVFDIRGCEYISFTQGGSDNDGTPTGTLAASYTMTG